MTPKEKAKELVLKFKDYADDDYTIERGIDSFYLYNNCKQSALICVDEMIEELEDIEDGYRVDRVEFWYKVKDYLKIENL